MRRSSAGGRLGAARGTISAARVPPRGIVCDWHQERNIDSSVIDQCFAKQQRHAGARGRRLERGAQLGYRDDERADDHDRAGQEACTTCAGEGVPHVAGALRCGVPAEEGVPAAGRGQPAARDAVAPGRRRRRRRPRLQRAAQGLRRRRRQPHVRGGDGARPGRLAARLQLPVGVAGGAAAARRRRRRGGVGGPPAEGARLERHPRTRFSAGGRGSDAWTRDRNSGRAEAAQRASCARASWKPVASPRRVGAGVAFFGRRLAWSLLRRPYEASQTTCRFPPVA